LRCAGRAQGGVEGSWVWGVAASAGARCGVGWVSGWVSRGRNGGGRRGAWRGPGRAAAPPPAAAPAVARARVGACDDERAPVPTAASGVASERAAQRKKRRCNAAAVRERAVVRGGTFSLRASFSRARAWFCTSRSAASTRICSSCASRFCTHPAPPAAVT
jgi:hypothetical protein